MGIQPCQEVPEAEAAVQKAVQKLTNQPKILPSQEIYPGVVAGEMAACKDPIFSFTLCEMMLGLKSAIASNTKKLPNLSAN